MVSIYVNPAHALNGHTRNSSDASRGSRSGFRLMADCAGGIGSEGFHPLRTPPPVPGPRHVLAEVVLYPQCAG